jgi:hypothetical protein
MLHFIHRNDKLEIIEIKEGFDCRNRNTISLIKQAVEKYNLKNFEFKIATDDFDQGNLTLKPPLFTYSTNINNYAAVFPDFIFENWKEIGIEDYNSEIQKIKEAGNLKYEIEKIGWRGAITHPNRKILINKTGRYIDATVNDWSNRKAYLSLPDMVKKYRWLIDIEGRGYSGRPKMFMFSKRLVFLQDRPCKCYLFLYAKPWVHYVPVKRDLSDLEAKIDIILKNPYLETMIIQNAYELAHQVLTKDYALKIIAENIEAFAKI